jgi:GAF domain-containing protein
VGVEGAARPGSAPEPQPSRWVQRALASDGPVGDLAFLVAASPALLDLADACIQLRAGQVRRTITCAGSPLASRLEECGPPRQRPSELAAHGGEPVQAPLPDPGRPALSEAAGRVGVRAVWSLPLRAYGSMFGAMTFYATDPEPWAGTRAGGARRMAQQVERIVSLAADRTRLEQMNANLWQALESRTTIGQAQGVLMATSGLSADAAFRSLARSSQDRHRKLRDVAADIVADLDARLASGGGMALDSRGSRTAGPPRRAGVALDGEPARTGGPARCGGVELDGQASGGGPILAG